MAFPSTDAVTVKADLLGSELTRGINTPSRSRAIRRVFVKGLRNDEGKASQAVEAVLDKVGTVYQESDESLNLDHIRVQTIGKDKAMGFAYYRRPTFFGSSSNGIRWRTGTVGVTVYKDADDGAGNAQYDGFGLPDGQLLISPADLANEDLSYSQIRSKQFVVPMIRLWVPTILNSDPTPSIAQYTGHINSDLVTFRGYEFGPFTIRHEGAVVQEKLVNGGAVYEVLYEFALRHFGWYHHNLTIADNFVAQNQIEVNVVKSHPELPFAGVFPIGL